MTYVDTTTDQTIGGSKTFSSPILLTNSPVASDNSNTAATTSFVRSATFVQDGTGARPQTLQQKAMRQVDTLDFCLCDGSLETQAFGDALAEAAVSGKTGELLHGGLVKTGNATLYPGGAIRGTRGGYVRFAGDSFYNNKAQIRLAAGSSLSVDNGATLESLFIVRDGLDDGSDESSLVACRNSMVNNGNGVVAAETANPPAVQDLNIKDCYLIGFNTAININEVGGGRVHIDRARIDSYNGISILTDADINIVENCHYFPFIAAGVETQNANSVSLHPGGIAYHIGGGSEQPYGGYDDGTIMRNNFAFGADIAFWLDSSIGARLEWQYADSVNTNPGSVGLKITGYSFDSLIDQFTLTNYKTGILVDVDTANQPNCANRFACYVYEGSAAATEVGLDIVHGNVFGRDLHLAGNTAAIRIGPSAGFVDLECAFLEGGGASGAAIVIDPAWAGTGRIALPTRGGWTNVISGHLPHIAAGRLQIVNAAPLHGTATNVFTRPLELHDTGAEIIFHCAANATGQCHFDTGVTTDGRFQIRNLTDDGSAVSSLFAIFSSTGPQFPLLPVAANDAAAAAMSPPVPVGGLYKTSTGVVMQRTT